MGPGIGVFLISAAAGYWVLARSSAEQGWVKTLGRVMGVLIIFVSLLSIPAAYRQARTQQQFSFARPGTFSAPTGQFRRPTAAPEFPAMPKPQTPEKESSSK